jgi:hypothetical protein
LQFGFFRQTISTSEPTKELVKMELLIFRKYQLDIKVNAWYSGSIVIEITLLINPYKFFLNDSNGHGCYFFNIIILIFE